MRNSQTKGAKDVKIEIGGEFREEFKAPLIPKTNVCCFITI